MRMGMGTSSEKTPDPIDTEQLLCCFNTHGYSAINLMYVPRSGTKESQSLRI